jgi:RimJ/RimL family protein N-acetyltransferase
MKPLPNEIRTDRLLLRPYSHADVEAVFQAASDEEWVRFLPLPTPYQRSDAEKFIASQLLLDRADHATWAITHEDQARGPSECS